MILAAAERKLGVAEKLAAVICDPLRVVHLLPDILRARIFAIACGYEDADNLDWLRSDPAFRLARGRLPDSGYDLCSQPTMSRWENAPTLRELVRAMSVMVDLYCASYSTPPDAVTLDIDAKIDVVHGHQQPRCTMPITTNAVFCRLISTTRQPGGPLP
jgi:Transposase DDE domain group 1